MDLFKRLATSLGFGSPSVKSTMRHAAQPNARGLNRQRQRLLEGFVVSDGMLAPRPCTLRDVSALGARVEIWDGRIKPSVLRKRLTLYIPSDGKEVDCDVMWKRDNLIGVKFTSPFRAPRRTYAV